MIRNVVLVVLVLLAAAPASAAPPELSEEAVRAYVRSLDQTYAVDVRPGALDVVTVCPVGEQIGEETFNQYLALERSGFLQIEKKAPVRPESIQLITVRMTTLGAQYAATVNNGRMQRFVLGLSGPPTISEVTHHTVALEDFSVAYVRFNFIPTVAGRFMLPTRVGGGYDEIRVRALFQFDRFDKRWVPVASDQTHGGKEYLSSSVPEALGLVKGPDLALDCEV